MAWMKEVSNLEPHELREAFERVTQDKDSKEILDMMMKGHGFFLSGLMELLEKTPDNTLANLYLTERKVYLAFKEIRKADSSKF